MRVVLVTNKLHDGGAERQVALWAKALTDSDHDVRVLTLHPPLADDAYSLPAQVDLDYLQPKRDLLGLFEVVRALRRCVDRTSDLVVAFQTYPTFACSLAHLPAPLLAVAGDDPRHWRDTSRIPAAGLKFGFRRAQLGCTPTQGMADCHKKMGITPRQGWRVIPNIVDEASFESPKEEHRDGVLFVGRLVGLKRPDLAIESARRAGAAITLLGRGPLQGEVERLAAQSKTAVTIAGFGDPWPEYARHRVLLVTSAYESFGNVIVESLGSGTPVISVDCDFGPREIIGDSRYSKLVSPDPDDIANALRQVLAREYTPAEAQECLEIASRYRLENVVPEIDALVCQIKASQ